MSIILQHSIDEIKTACPNCKHMNSAVKLMSIPSGKELVLFQCDNCGCEYDGTPKVVIEETYVITRGKRY